MREIKLSRGLVAIVDDDVYEWANQYKWYAAKGNKTFYAARSTPRPNRKNVYLHREIMGLGHFVRGGPEVDHIDRNGLNNQTSNLRVVDHRNNALNRGKSTIVNVGMCQHCYAPFVAKHKRQKYCDSSCFGKQNMINRESRKMGLR